MLCGLKFDLCFCPLFTFTKQSSCFCFEGRYISIQFRKNFNSSTEICDHVLTKYMGADKSLARPGKKEATATEDFDVHISYLLS